MAVFRAATFNLYHFAEPGIWWYAHEPDAPEAARPCFSAAEWAAKTSWISNILAEINADAVGFQEVVSVDALRRLCADAGYPHFAVAAEPKIIDDAGASVYRRPVQAVAARMPFTAEAAAAPAGFASAFGLAEGWNFRRPPVLARFEPPGMPLISLFCCHLKSPGAALHDVPMAEDSGLPAEAQEAQALSRAHAFAAMQRVLEASALRHLACAEAAAFQGKPHEILIVGDLNDTADSPALRALTAAAPSERDGGAAEAEAVPAGPFALRDAYRLSPRDLKSDSRPPTHRSGAAGEAIDFILTSAGRAGGALTVAGHQVWSRHFIAGEPRTTSDHAPVSAAFTAAR